MLLLLGTLLWLPLLLLPGRWYPAWLMLRGLRPLLGLLLLLVEALLQPWLLLVKPPGGIRQLEAAERHEAHVGRAHQ